MNLLNIGKTRNVISPSIVAFRCLLAAIIMAHGWARFLAGGVEPFGSFLDAQGFPLGIVIAAGITLIEIGGAPVFAIGRFVPYLAGVFSLIYTMGIILVHAPEGWFVVGLGRNGMEYSVLLISSLTLVGVHHWTAQGSNQPLDDGKVTDN